MTWDDVHTALMARIAAVNGMGGFTFNFSATGAITRSQPGAAPWDTMPQVPVCQAGGMTTEAPELTAWEIRERFEIAAIVPPGVLAGTVDDADGRIRSAEVAAEDIENAIIADRTLGANVHDLRISAVEALDGASIANVGCPVGIIYLVVETMRYKQGVP